MEIFIIAFVILLFVTSIVMPWVNHTRISGQKNEIDQLNQELKRLSHSTATIRESFPEKVYKSTAKAEKPAVPEKISSAATLSSEADKLQPIEPDLKNQAVAMETFFDKAQASSIEEDTDLVNNTAKSSQDWFGRLAVWVGGIALLMAGFYMVKYSIESGWVTPAVRLWSTILFGALLCICGFWVSVRSLSAGNLRIGQALTGAGVACFYFAVYAAVNLYGMLSSGFGFTGMVGVTVLAVSLSMRQGAPVALMGFIGGFLTPLLMGGADTDSVLLFVYLFVLFGAVQFTCTKRGWWGLLFVSFCVTYVWSGGLLLWHMLDSAASPEGAMLFILGIVGLNSVIGIVMSPESDDKSAKIWQLCIRLMAWGGGLLQGLVLLSVGEFQAVDMALFSVLGLGALLLAVLREETYLWVAGCAFFAVLLGTLFNTEPSLLRYSAWPFCVTLVFFVIGHFKALRSTQKTLWQALSLSALCLAVPIAFINREWLLAAEMPFTSFWFTLSLAAGSLIFLAAEHLNRIADSNRLTVGNYSAVASFLIGFGLWDYVPEDYLSIAAAGSLLAVVCYWRMRNLERVQLVLGAWIGVWIVTILERFSDAAYYLVSMNEFEVTPSWIDLGSWYFGCAVLVLAFNQFGTVLKKSMAQSIGWLPGSVCVSALVVTYHYIDVNGLSDRISEQSILGGLTALLTVLAMVTLFAAKRWKGFVSASWVLSALAGFRILTLHLFSSGSAGESFFYNALFWQFGVPFCAVLAMAWMSRGRAYVVSGKCYQIAAMLLGFIWATFLVQDYFGSAHLFASVDTSTELYAYSLVWLLLAIIYQGIGLWRSIQTLHVGSLILLLLTIGKVFLVDASELEGLYRVLSFLGLGISLIGIGFFYNKVVFGKGSEDST